MRPLFSIFSLSGLLFLTSSVPPQPHRGIATHLLAETRLLRFEPNLGQADPQVDYLARAPNYVVFLSRGSAVLAVPMDSLASAEAIRHLPGPSTLKLLRMTFLDTDPGATGAGEQPFRGRSNYLIGNDPAKWRTNVPHYGRVRYQDLYPGIDLIYRAGEQLEYDLVVRPGSDPGAIRFAFQGAEQLHIGEDGSLQADLAGGRVIQLAPRVYQEIGGERVMIPGQFRLVRENVFAFQVGPYDTRRGLTIDPVVMVYSTYVGGAGYESPSRIAVDGDGMAYVTGETYSTDFPVTPGSFQTTMRSSVDAYVVKIDPGQSGANSLIFATFLGSSGPDGALGIAVDPDGRAFVTGWTTSGDFPTTTDAFKRSWSPAVDETDAFIAALSPNGDQLFYSTFFGGNRDDAGLDITLRGPNLIYIAGDTDAGTFPTTPGAYDTSGKFNSVFLSVLDRAAGSLNYSTVLHGSLMDYARGLAVDSAGKAHVAGIARSNNFPTTPNAFMATAPAGTSSSYGALGSFLSVIDPTKTGAQSLVYSTYLGVGDAQDVDVDTAGNAYVIGRTISPTFPTTAGAFDTVCEDLIIDTGNGLVNLGCAGDAFVMKIDPSQSGAASLRYSTRLGGSWGEYGNGIAVDASGNAYVTGSTASHDFPLRDPISGTTGRPARERDAFVTKIGPSGDRLIFSTRLGGTTGAFGTSDAGTGIAIDGSGNIYVTGSTETADFPIRGGFDASLGGTSDAFFAKLRYDACAGGATGIAPGRFDWEDIFPVVCLTWDTGEFGLFQGFPRKCPVEGCPKCSSSLSRIGPFPEPPDFLSKVYEHAGGLVLGPPPRNPSEPRARSGGGGGDLPMRKTGELGPDARPAKGQEARSGLASLARQIRGAKTGNFFTEEMKSAVLASLENAFRSRKTFRAARGKLLETLNAMELDWRSPATPPLKVAPGDRSVVDLYGVARLQLRGVEQGGEVALRIRPGVPAVPEGYRTGWPMATFSFEFAGKFGKAGGAEAELYAGWIGFSEPGELRLLEWDGEAFRDVTKDVNYADRTIRAEIDFRHEYVLVKLWRCLRWR